MVSRNGSPTSPPSPTRTPLERLRLEKGDVRTVRTLSEAYKGFLTHYRKEGSPYCPGKDLCKFHFLAAVWKGYCVIEDWDQAANLWVPKVLEITESLDQDFWGRFARGQVWELAYKKRREKGKAWAVTGKFWEQLDPYTLPEPYDMTAVITSTYHTDTWQLNMDNPMPRRLLVEPSRGHAPCRPGEIRDLTGPASAEEVRKILERRAAHVLPMKNGALGE